MKPFDGCKVVETTFRNVGKYQRFFLENGKGYTKTGYDSCCDDYSLSDIFVEQDALVFVKEGMV